MNKQKREELAYDIRVRELEAMDRDSTALFFKLLALWAGAVGIYVSVFISLKWQITNSTFLIPVMVFLIIYVGLIYSQNQTNKYLKDYYEGIFEAIKKNEILDFQFPLLGWKEILRYNPKYI